MKSSRLAEVEVSSFRFRTNTRQGQCGRAKSRGGAIKDHSAAMEIKDADFDRIEVIGDLIRHIEIVNNERRQHGTKVERLAK
jgi:hypothetical protein